jgi:Lrp/AsnC family transcriptional regulator, regulator for asnA, asnC and gidA
LSHRAGRPAAADAWGARSAAAQARGAEGGRRPGRRPGHPHLALDDVSTAIVEQLQRDGRRSYVAIGKALGLSETAVRRRVRRLLDGGAIQIVAVTHPMTSGFRKQAMIGVRCDGDLRRVADQLAAMDEIDYVVITAGSFDLLAEVVCEDEDRLLATLSRLRGIPSVIMTEPFVYLRLRKQTHG